MHLTVSLSLEICLSIAPLKAQLGVHTNKSCFMPELPVERMSSLRCGQRSEQVHGGISACMGEVGVSGNSGFAHLCVASVRLFEKIAIEAIDVQDRHRFLRVASLLPLHHKAEFLQVRFDHLCMKTQCIPVIVKGRNNCQLRIREDI